LTKKNAYDILLKYINDELEQKNILLKTGLIVDASVTDSLRKPRGISVYDIEEDRHELDQEQTDQEQTDEDTMPDNKDDAPSKPKRKMQSHVDTEAAWIKKNGKLHYGFKKHVGTDTNGLVISVITTPANESDMNHIKDVVEKSAPNKDARVFADKGYSSADNRNYLKEHGYKSGIMHKAVRGTPLTERQKQFNKIVSKTRYKIERTFGGIKRWFASREARYVGIKKMHTQHVLESIAYNLYRTPGIIMSQL
jgi:IS5 family transposase